MALCGISFYFDLIEFFIVKEAGRKLPPFPFHFLKPGTCIADHGAPVAIPKIAQDSQADYEGELVVVIGEDCKNVEKEDALKYVAGYTSGNDVSARTWQRDAGLLTFSKGFDQFAPLGPCLVSSKVRLSPSEFDPNLIRSLRILII